MEPSSRNGKRQHEQSDSENEDDNDTKPIPTAHYQISSKVARREETGVDETQAALINTSSFCDEDLKCLVCLETITDAMITKCGHTFCKLCVGACIKESHACPECLSPLRPEDIFPNHTLNAIIDRVRETADAPQFGIGLSGVLPRRQPASNSNIASSLTQRKPFRGESSFEQQSFIERAPFALFTRTRVTHSGSPAFGSPAHSALSLPPPPPQPLSRPRSEASADASASAASASGLSSSNAGRYELVDRVQSLMRAIGDSHNPRVARRDREINRGKSLSVRLAAGHSSSSFSEQQFALPKRYQTPPFGLAARARPTLQALALSLTSRSNPNSQPSTRFLERTTNFIEQADIDTLNSLLAVINTRKRRLQEDTYSVRVQIVAEFLDEVHVRAKSQLEFLKDVTTLVRDDRESLIASSAAASSPQDTQSEGASHRSSLAPSQELAGPAFTSPMQVAPSPSPTPERPPHADSPELSSAPRGSAPLGPLSFAELCPKRERFLQLFDDLLALYIENKNSDHAFCHNFPYSVKSDAPVLESDEANDLRNVGDARGHAKIERVEDEDEEPDLALNALAAEPSHAETLRDFTEQFSKAIRFTRFRPLASINFVTEPNAPSKVISSVEFDKQNELLAVSGITKRIKVYSYETVVRNAQSAIGELRETNYPLRDLSCSCKISCLAWNSEYRQHLICSDYEGHVLFWDVHAGQMVRELQAHEKRAWAVDFNKHDPRQFASGSDDGKLKVWQTLTHTHTHQIDLNTNVCAVQFPGAHNAVNQSASMAFAAPADVIDGYMFDPKYHLAAGGADHNVYIYDLRKATAPVLLLRSHSKAVSYTKFLSSNKQLVTASTDSSLKLWNVGDCLLHQQAAPSTPISLGMTPVTEYPQPIRTFRGHLNEKNFVGLCSDTEDMLVTGSESGFVYLYYKYMPRPILRFNFQTLETLNGTSDQVLSSEVSFANASATRATPFSRALPTTPLTIGQQLTFPDAAVIGQPAADAANVSLSAGDSVLDRSGDPASLLVFGAPSRGPPSALGAARSSNNSALLAGLGMLGANRMPALSLPNFASATAAAAPTPSNPSNASEFFISGIAWKLGSNVIAAANSLGIVRILELS